MTKSTFHAKITPKDKKSNFYMIGKKQRDIREDNKSVVIDCLLRSQMTLADLEQQLKLSHTALRKVMSELMQLNIVRVIDIKAGDMGRPSAHYDINPDCGFAAAVCLGVRRLEIFVVDMKGLQINEFISENEFSCAEELFEFTKNKLKTLLEHYRIKSAKLSTVCVSLPLKGVGVSDFEQSENLLKNGFYHSFGGAEVIVKNNNDFWATGESKYGALHHYCSGALLCEIEGEASCSLFFDHINYSGEKIEKGSINSLSDSDVLQLLEGVCNEQWTLIAKKYRAGDIATVKNVNGALSPLIDKISVLAFLLCVPLVIVGGLVRELGDGFLNEINRALQKKSNAKAVYSEITGRSPSCAGAVWCASYTSLKKLL